MKNEQWTKDELRALVRELRTSAKENEKEAMDDPDRRGFLEGGADALAYAAKEIGRILKGKTRVEALAETLNRARKDAAS